MKLMTWPQMLAELIGMIQAADESTTPDVYHWAMDQLQRVGEHLENLPPEHRCAAPSFAVFHDAKRAIMDAV
jgi:hypothetical protein